MRGSSPCCRSAPPRPTGRSCRRRRAPAPHGAPAPPPPIAGTTSFTSSLAGLPTNGALGIVFVIDASALGQRKDMLVTKELLAGILPGTPRTGLLGPILAPIPNYGGSLRAVIKWTSGALSGSPRTGER